MPRILEPEYVTARRISRHNVRCVSWSLTFSPEMNLTLNQERSPSWYWTRSFVTATTAHAEASCCSPIALSLRPATRNHVLSDVAGHRHLRSASRTSAIIFPRPEPLLELRAASVPFPELDLVPSPCVIVCTHDDDPKAVAPFHGDIFANL